MSSSEPVAVAPGALAPLSIALRRLRHDLGKSMSLQLRFAGPQTKDADLVEALQQDVLHTRRDPRGSRSATSLFDEARPWLTGDADLPATTGVRVDLSADSVMCRLSEIIEVLRAHEAAIAAGTVQGELLRQLVDLAHEGTARCRELGERYRGDDGG
ncbi:MAG: hypothetical protein AAF211_20990 [Myxococcota bacterium]